MSGAPLETRTLDRCLACGGDRVGRFPLRYEYRGAAFPLVECRACGMRFLALQPAGRSLAELYAAPYFEADFRCGRSATTSFDEQTFAAENRALLQEFARLGPPGRLLEVGSAAGWLLRDAARTGWEAEGVELSADAVAFARSLGLRVFHGDLPAVALPSAHYDLVYMGDVLEHVPDCRAALAEAARVLKPGGHLYLRGPITTHSLARSLGLRLYRLLGRDIVLREPPYHLWEFTPRSLRSLARACGLEVVRLTQSKIAPGRAHGHKSALQRLVMATLDVLNLPLTALMNARGDRVVLVARKAAC